MGKLFITLYALLAAAIIGFSVAARFLPETLLRNTFSENFEYLSKGTYYLVEQELSYVEDELFEEKLKQIQTLFGYKLAIQTFEDSKLNAKEYQRVLSGEMVFKNIDGAAHIFRRFAATKKVWVAALEQTNQAHHHSLTIGTFRLIDKVLRALPQSQWDEKIKELNRHFGFPVQLLRTSELKIKSAEKTQALLNQRVAAMHIDKPTEHHYYALANTDLVLRIGPYSEPFILTTLNPILQLTLAVLVAIVTLIWIRPLWRGLVQIRSATEAFGRGEFAARVSVNSRSAVGQVAKTFNAMAQRIERLICSHKELTNAVSHELRTPISRLRFGMEMFKNARDEATRQRYLDSMNTDIDELDELVSELLTYARFDRDTPELKIEIQPLPEWLMDVVTQSNNDHGDVNVELKHSGNDAGQKVSFDSKLMTRAVSNLLRNAKCHAKHKVEISSRNENNRFYILVDDDGIGIPEIERERVFDAFTRLDASRGRHTGGYGLGLAIVKRIMQWHAGEVSVTDSPLGGARFILTWPQNVVT